MEEIKAYKSIDGKLFLTKEQVLKYELNLKNINFKKEVSSFVNKYINTHQYSHKNIVRNLIDNKEELIKILNKK